MVDFVELIFTAFIEAGAVFLAIYLEFKREREEKEKEFWKRVREIAPYIYYEILENKWLIYEFLREKYKFPQDQRRFNFTNWEIFKDHLSKWREWNVIPITRLYTKLIQANRLLDTIDIDPNSRITREQDQRLSIIHGSLNNVEGLINKVEEQFDKWFKENPKANKEKEKILNELKKNAKNDRVLSAFLSWYYRVYNIS
jgi:hypothetical protein